MSETNPPFTYPDPYKSDPYRGEKEKPHQHPPQEPIDLPVQTIYQQEEAARPSQMQFAVALVVVVFLISVGIGFFAFRDENDGGEDGTSPPPPVADVTPPPPPPSTEITDTQLISASNGGVLKTADGAEVIIPSGALEKDTEISIKKVAKGKLTDRYELLPDNITFLQPVLVRLPYNEEVLANAEEVKVEIWSRYRKRLVLDHTIDLADKKLEASLTKF